MVGRNAVPPGVDYDERQRVTRWRLPGRNEDRGRTGTSRVVRTVFDGAKRAVALGSLSNEHIVQILARSIVTVALSP